MGLEYRNGNAYFYQKVRIGKRVTSRYVGAGEAAMRCDRIAQRDRDVASKREERARKRRERLERLDRELDRLADEAIRQSHQLLNECGFFQHHRGEWRKRRCRTN